MYRQKTGNHGVPPEEREQIRRSLLLNADVICGTLSSIGSQALLEVFGNNGRKENFKPHFKCIIIDEVIFLYFVQFLIQNILVRHIVD